MRAGMMPRAVLGGVIFISLAGFEASRLALRNSAAPAERRLPPSSAVRRAFSHFADSAGTRLVDTLFTLGYHGGYSWDEKSGPVRANLIVRADSGTVADSASGVSEGILSLDFHNDVHEDVPPELSLRFVHLRDSPKWILLTTDGLPEDPSPDMPLETLRKLPQELHNALLASFSDHAEAFDFWKLQEHRPPVSGTATTARP